MTITLINYYFWTKENFNFKIKNFLLIKTLNLKKQNNFLIHLNLLKRSKIRLASVKTKSQVRGGGKKPKKQKGTGTARLGSIRSPLLRGGGVIFGPKPLKKTFKINKKEKKLYLSILLYNKQKNIKIINDFYLLNFEKIKNLIKNFPITNKIVFIYSIIDYEIIKLKSFFKNFSNIKFILKPNLMIFLKFDTIFYSLNAFIDLKSKLLYTHD